MLYTRVFQTVGPGPKFGPLTDFFLGPLGLNICIEFGPLSLKPTNDYYWS